MDESFEETKSHSTFRTRKSKDNKPKLSLFRKLSSYPVVSKETITKEGYPMNQPSHPLLPQYPMKSRNRKIGISERSEADRLAMLRELEVSMAVENMQQYGILD